MTSQLRPFSEWLTDHAQGVADAEATAALAEVVEVVVVPPHPRRPAGPYCPTCGTHAGHWDGCPNTETEGDS